MVLVLKLDILNENIDTEKMQNLKFQKWDLKLLEKRKNIYKWCI